MLGYGHATFDADPHPLGGLRSVRREEALQKRHSESPGYMEHVLSYETRGRRVTPIPRESADVAKCSLDPGLRQKVGIAPQACLEQAHPLR